MTQTKKRKAIETVAGYKSSKFMHFFYKLWKSVRRCSRINTAFIPVGGTESPMPNGLGGQVTSSAEAA